MISVTYCSARKCPGPRQARYDVKTQKARPRTGTNDKGGDSSFYGLRCDQVDMMVRAAAPALVTAENRDADPPELSVRFDCRKPAEVVWEATMNFQVRRWFANSECFVGCTRRQTRLAESIYAPA